MDSKYINATKGRLTQGLTDVIKDVVSDEYIEKKVEKAIADTKVYSGTVTKYFPYLNKSEVVLDGMNKTVICKNSLPFGNELLLLYTPTGDGGFSKKLNERFIKPRGNLKAYVVKVENSKEYLLITYYLSGELTGVNPAKQGNVKLVLRSGANEYYIKFGEDGLKIVTNKEVELHLREFANEDLKEYDKKYYTMEEIDNKLYELMEPQQEPEDEDESNTISQSCSLLDKTLLSEGRYTLNFKVSPLLNDYQTVLIDGVDNLDYSFDEDNVVHCTFDYKQDKIRIHVLSLQVDGYNYTGCSLNVSLN